MNGHNLSDLCYINGSLWSVSFEKIKVGSVLIVTMTVCVSERDGSRKDEKMCYFLPNVCV